MVTVELLFCWLGLELKKWEESTKREANIVAHDQAKFASISCLECTWLYETPECILPSVQHDYNIDA